jgi:hypothetical protein
LVRLRPEHDSPVEQEPLLPVPQQGCPSAPQAAHLLAVGARTHSCGAVHAVTPPSTRGPPVVAQQTWSGPPHGLQVPAVPEAASRPVQASPVLQVPALPVPQQAWPAPPQAAEQTLPPAASMHERPLPHVAVPVPGQQAWPDPPHGLHVPAPPSPSRMQPRPLWQLLPAQQASPLAPQLSQVPAPVRPVGLLQPRPALQVLPLQHGAPDPPHAEQVETPASTDAQTSASRH